jgi:hypothetical protein
MFDADGSADPDEIPRFIEALVEGADFAKGSRFRPGGGSADITAVRRLGNRFLHTWMNVSFGTRFTDLCYGYNAFWADLIPLLELPDFIWHGVRHIVSSGLARLKVAPHIARLAMDHAPVGDVHAGYEHVDWTPEVAAAMELWASHVEKLVAPGAGVAVLR